MAITSALATSFKQELLEAKHNFLNSGGSAFKLALFKPSVNGTYGAATTNYSDMTGSSDEVPNGSGYTTGGNTLTRVDPATSGTTAYTDFADSQWTNSTFSTDGVMCYNTSDSNSCVFVQAFASTVSVVAGTLTVVFPTADASNAIIRLA